MCVFFTPNLRLGFLKCVNYITMGLFERALKLDFFSFYCTFRLYFFFLMWEKIAVYLSSPLAQFVTGMTLTVDGGMDMRG